MQMMEGSRRNQFQHFKEQKAFKYLRNPIPTSKEKTLYSHYECTSLHRLLVKVFLFILEPNENYKKIVGDKP
jgi:hypothetical protein